MKPVLLSWLLAVGFLLPPAFANPVHTNYVPRSSRANAEAQSQQLANFNLHSSLQLFSAGTLNGLNQVILQLGHQSLIVTSASMLTAGERVALDEVLSGSQQTLVLNSHGQATGGSFQLGSVTQAITGLVIPRGVTAIDNLVAGLSLSGNLINAGDFLVVSTNSQITLSKINALNIFNLAGGLITSETVSTSSHLSLSLSALQNIVNSGSIISSGNLSLAAGGSIANQPAAGSGAQPLMQAFNNLNLSSGSGIIVNAGLISSLSNNINISSPSATNIIFNNAGGVLQAFNGTINFRDASFNQANDLTVTGGNLSAQSVNFYSGQGTVSVDVDGLAGTVNVFAQNAHVTAATNTLDLGAMQLSGDPTIYNTDGDVIISGDLNFSGQDLTIVASGNIDSAAGAGAIDTSSGNGDGGAITMIAGANFHVAGGGADQSPSAGDTTDKLIIVGASSSGGSIDLSTAAPITSLTSASTANGGNGGDITLVAFAGGASGSGTITLPQGVTLTTGGGGSDSNGNVSIIAGAGTGTAITMGAVNTSGGSGGGGNITIAAAQPYITGSDHHCSPCVVIQAGGAVDYTAGWFTSYWWSSNSASVSVGDLTAPGSRVSVNSGGSIQTGSINVSSATANGGSVYIDSGGTINITGSVQANGSALGGNGGNIDIWTYGGDVTVGDTMSANGVNSGGGSVYISASNISVNGSVTASASASGDGGSVGLWAGQGNLFVNGDVRADAAGSGNGGYISLSSSSANAFLIGGATVNGVAGIISAQADSNGSLVSDGNDGAGGSVYVANRNASGGIVFTNFNNLLVTAAENAEAGSISLYASGGALTLSQGVLSVDTNYGNTGGSISLTGDSIVVISPNGGSTTMPLLLNADGSVSVSTNISDLSIGNQAGQIAITTQGWQSSYSAPNIVPPNGVIIPGNCLICIAGPVYLLIAQPSWPISLPSGPGGNVYVSAGGNLTVDPNAMTLGNAPNISLVAGTHGPGNLLITGNLIADGSNANGTGGSIYLSSNSTAPFVIGGATVNGVTGILSANGVRPLPYYNYYYGDNYLCCNDNVIICCNAYCCDGSPASGGSISVTNNGTGGITLPNTGNISASASYFGGNGGSISFYAPNGTLTIAQGTLSVDAHQREYPFLYLGNVNIGSITSGYITIGSINFQDFSLYPAGQTGGNGAVINLSPTGQNNQYNETGPSYQGGQISLVGQSIVVTGANGGPATGALNLSANGMAGGVGGSIYISQRNGDLTIGNGAGQIAISVQGIPATQFISNFTTIGGTTYDAQITNYGAALYNNYAQVTVTTGGNLTVNMAALQLGAAANVNLSAGTAGPGNLLITGSLIADGVAGQGGTVTLSSNSSSPFVIGGATVNGITGVISANGSPPPVLFTGTLPGPYSVNSGEVNPGPPTITLNSLYGGSGGTISVTNSGDGGITLTNTQNISAKAASNGAYGGNGGSITLNAGTGILTIAQGTISVNGVGTTLGPSNNNSVVLENSLDSTGSSSAVIGIPIIFCCYHQNNTCCNGGNIILEGQQIQITKVDGGKANGTLNLSANGSGAGNAGSVSVVTQAGDLAIGNQAGGITISAVSGSTYSSVSNSYYYPPPPCNFCAVPLTTTTTSTTVTNTAGSASNYVIAYPIYPFGFNYTGKVFISAGGNLTVDPNALAVGPAAGTNANGANIYLIAGTGASGGSLLVTGSLSANGSGTGNGGHVVLASNSQDTFVVSANASGITNGVEGIVTANGVNGGSILLATAGGINADRHAIEAEGNPGSDGTISYMSFSDATNDGELCCAGGQSYFWFYPLLDEVPPALPPATITNSGATGLASNTNSQSSNSENSSITPSIDANTRITSAQIASTELNAASNQLTSEIASVALPTDVTNTKLIEASVIGNNDLSALPTSQTSKGLSYDATASTGGSTFSLESGNVLFSPANNMQVETPQGTVQIAQDSTALIMIAGDDLAIYDLHDSLNRGIKVVAYGNVINLGPGKQLVLTRGREKTFAEANPGATIACRQVKSYNLSENIKVFACEFSLTSAIAQVRPLQQMVASNNPRHQKLIAQLIKNAAILSQISNGHGPYKIKEVKNSELSAKPLSDNSN